jgi:FkbM family methyltransferase
MSINLKRSISKRIKMLSKMLDGSEDESGQVSYSQQGEDLTILRLLGYKSNGFYIDVGAFNPVKYSNTHLFYKNGWRGINIEPNPDARAEFLKQRENDLNLNIAIGNSNEELSYYKFNDPALNSFSKEHVEKWDRINGFHLTDVIKIEMHRLEDVLAQYLAVDQKIDFMTVDVENFDLEVLKSNNWNLYRPYLLLVEEDLLNFNAYHESLIVSYLKDQNYELTTICNGTLFFKDLMGSPSF